MNYNAQFLLFECAILTFSHAGKFFCRAHYFTLSGAFKTAKQKTIEKSGVIREKAGDTLIALTQQGMFQRLALITKHNLVNRESQIEYFGLLSLFLPQCFKMVF